MRKSVLIMVSLFIVATLIFLGCSQQEEQSTDTSLPISEDTVESNSDNSSDKVVLKVAFTLPPDHHLSKFFTLVYTEAFSRMDIDFQIEHLPPERASEYSDQGLVDGEINRVYSYNETNSNLIRVEEPHMYIRFSAFSTDPELQLYGWESLKNTEYRVEYRLGVKKSELMLPQYVSEDNLIIGYAVEDAIQHLMDNKTDLYVDVENTVEGYLHSTSFNKDIEIFNSGMMEETTGHAFLHKKNSDLVPKLSDIIKDMKSEGLFDQYIEDLGLSQYDILIH